MKAKFTLCLGLLFCAWTVAFSQPANDDCSNPQVINLNSPAPCPSTTPVNTVVNGTTTNATPISPYPLLQCTNGDQNDGPAAEVWYSFVGVSNVIDIIVNGLHTPNVILFRGTDCSFLTPQDCDRGSNGTLTLTQNILVGETYYLMVSGGDISDQGNFTLTIRSRNNCNPCLLDQTLTVSPPPINGTYSSGQEVTVCMTINDWDVTSTIEWLHAVTVQFGPGWDVTSLLPQPPAPCTATGDWHWYDSWVSSNTGQVFGPGFAFDSSQGGPFDGNPGNNWGDPCQNPGGGDFPITFCWTVSVSDCMDTGGPNFTGNDLSMVIEIWSDGDSGSWTQTGCNSGFTFNFLASVVCCSGIEPIAVPTPTSCPGANDGSIQIDPLGGTYQYYVFYNNGSTPITTIPPTSNIVDLNNLATGSYSIVAVDIASGCNLSVNPQPVVITDGDPPQAFPDADTPCPGNPFTLTGSTDGFGSNIQYHWTGPGGFNQNGQVVHPTQAGTYTLVVTVDGCQSEPQTVNAQFVDFFIEAQASQTSVCVGASVEFAALGTGITSVQWINTNTGQVLGTSNPFDYTFTQTDLADSPITIQAVATDVNGCEATDDLVITVNPLSEITLDVQGTWCVGSTITVTASGAQSYFWEDGLSDNPRFFVIDQPGPFQFQIFGQDANGCQAEGLLDIYIDPSPTVSINASATTICKGESVTLTGVGANSYSWSTGANNTPSITITPMTTTIVSVLGTNLAGCSDDAEVTITVVDPITAPVVSCGAATPNSVSFTWPAVTGATGYNVTVNSGQTGTLTGTTYSVTGLAPGTPVSITVVAISPNPACPNPSTTITCNSVDCPMETIAITPVADICFEAGLPVIDLEATITGGMAGTDSWSGPGITNPATGIFNVDTAGVGNHQIIFTHAEGLCVYTDTTVIRIFDIPTAGLSIADAQICNNQSTTVTFTGTAGAGATYTWDFGGGIADPGTGPGPHQVNWTASGPKTVTVSVTENGCTSETASASIDITDALTPPAIACGNATTTSAEFTWGPVAGSTGFTVNVISGPTGTLNGNTYTVTGLSPGQSVEIQVVAETDDPCGSVSSNFTCSALPCPDFVFDITPVDPICLGASSPPVTLAATVTGGTGGGAMTWSGPGVTGNSFNPQTAGAGNHTLTVTYAEGPCTESEDIVVQVFAAPVAGFAFSQSPACINQPVTITFNGTVSDPNTASFTWNFNGGTANPNSGAGPIDVTWATAGQKTVTLTVTENGCTSAVFSQNITIQNPMPEPVVSCIPSPSSIEFSWADVPGATGYQVTVLSGPAGVQSGNTYTVTGLVPGDMVEIQVTALGNGPCGNSVGMGSCTAEDCPDITLAIDPVAPICLDASATAINLNGTVTGGDRTGAESWTGTGVSPQGGFTPSAAGPGSHIITFRYQQGNCPYNVSITIVVNEQPSSTFTADQSVCAGDPITVTYTGGADPGATYNWDFDGGTVVSGTGAGPYTISWPTGGGKQIELVVIENNCPSVSSSVAVEVADPIAAPVISCETTTTSINFTWPAVTGATGYTVNVLTGQTGTQNGNSYLITGLMPEETATIVVTAQTANICGPSMTEQTCSADPCPSITVTPQAPGALCADSDIQTLTANITGGAGGGTLTWAGTGVTDPSGTFDPAMVSGTTTVTATYVEGVCSYTADLDISVNPVPVASFTAAGPACTGQDVMVTFDGAAGAGAVYDWNFDGGTVASGTGQGPYAVSWPTAGAKTISLTVTENGCVSAAFTATVDIEAPLTTPQVFCLETSTSSITYGWHPVAGAQGYEVTVVDGPQGVLSDTTYTINNLTPNQEITIQVVATGSGACGNSSPGSATCIANNCLPLSLNLSPSVTLCEGSSTQLTFDFNTASAGPFEVTYSINGAQQAPITLSDNGVVPFNNVTDNISLVVISILDLSDANCTYPGNAAWDLTVNQSVDAGIAGEPVRFCQGEGQTVLLSDLLEGAQTGGVWTETSAVRSTGGAFNAAGGTFNPVNQLPATYTFLYHLDAGDPCPDDETTVTVIIEPTPKAVAGEDQLLTCDISLVSLGGNSSSGNGITYAWSSGNPDVVISDPTSPLIDVSQAGVYTLTVTNDLGCSSTDSVEVTSENASPVASLSISQISCFQANDGAITVDGVQGGTPPYQFSFNGGPFNGQTHFAFLGPAAYTVVVRDQNGCSSEVSINLTQPEELTVTLVTDLEAGQNTIENGDEITLRAVFDPNVVLDTIIWKPDSLALGNNPTSISVMPTETTQFSVTIVDENGCSDSDDETIFVRKVRPVYIPSAFSPNNDGFNDIFYIQARDNSVTRIKSFLIFNRWGENMMELYDFQPNDPGYGWDGKHRSRPMNPGVYVYFAEIEFTDGEVILYKGDVNLLK